MGQKRPSKRANFVPSNEKAESDVVANIVRIARKARLKYDDFLYVSQQARKKLGLRRPKKERRLPHLLPEAKLKRFFQTIQDCGNVQHEILLKLLFYTAVRLSEFVSIKLADIDLDRYKIFTDQGKRAKDRYILFPASFRLVLKSDLRGSPQNRYLLRPGFVDHSRHGASSRSFRNTVETRDHPARTPTSVPSPDAYLFDNKGSF